MINLKDYNQKEKESLDKILELETEDAEFWKTHSSIQGGTPEFNWYDSLINKIHKLNPLRYKDDADDNEGIYSTQEDYLRKLPLDKFDGKIIDLIQTNINSWNFLQIRTKKCKSELEYILMFKKKGIVNEERMKSYLKSEEGWGSYEYSKKLLEYLKINKLRKEIVSLLSHKYKLKGFVLAPEVTWGGQGEARFYTNHKYLFINLILEERKSKKKELKKEVELSRKKFEEAKSKLRNY